MQGVERGCGRRVQCGVYMETPLGPHGRPVEDFLVDPPVPVDVDKLGLSAIGVKLTDRPGRRDRAHVLDWVGEQHYPCVADFVEEVQRHGLSRRIARMTNFARLDAGTRIFLVHARAIIRDPRDAYWSRGWTCPRALAEHGPDLELDTYPNGMCAGLWWEDVPSVSAGGLRQRPGFAYRARMRPLDVDRDERERYAPGIFAAFPVSQLAVIRARDGSHEVAEHAARASGLPVVIEND